MLHSASIYKLCIYIDLSDGIVHAAVHAAAGGTKLCPRCGRLTRMDPFKGHVCARETLYPQPVLANLGRLSLS